MRRGQYDVTMRPSRPRNIPKKLLYHKQIKINETYSFMASIWIPDTPHSNLKPTVNLTLSHNNDKIRFCFNSTVELIDAIEEIRKFIGHYCTTLHKRLIEARDEYHSFHLEHAHLTPNYDSTEYTVIQGDNEVVLVNKYTGNIIKEELNETEKIGRAHV